MSGPGKCQLKFIIHIVQLYLGMRGRKNYMMMGRYGTYGEQSYRQHFEKDFDFRTFNRTLIAEHCSSELAWIFDPSYINKSGKHTPGTGYFWSGSANSMKWGLELGALAIADLENHTALHYHAQQTKQVKATGGEENLRTNYAKLIQEESEEMLKISKVIVFDAFFSKNPFVDSTLAMGFTLISRLQSNIYLRYAYQGEQQEGRGRPKVFDGKIDIKNVSTQHFTILESSEDKIIYEGVAHVRCLKRWCKIVIVNTLKDGKVNKAFVYFSTDKDMLGQQVYKHYKVRYQIEFLFRDAKNHLGLEDSQSRQEKALDFHFNLTLTTLNIAKAIHWLTVPKDKRGAFSMADIKTQYVNELVLDRLISIYGKDPEVEKNNPAIRELYNLGKIAA
jgi:hypothetical protein